MRDMSTHRGGGLTLGEEPVEIQIDDAGDDLLVGERGVIVRAEVALELPAWAIAGMPRSGFTVAPSRAAIKREAKSHHLSARWIDLCMMLRIAHLPLHVAFAGLHAPFRDQLIPQPCVYLRVRSTPRCPIPRPS